MVCRLCLKNTCYSTIELFDVKSESNEFPLVKIIFKFLDLKVEENDTVSTHICYECYQELFNINNYKRYIKKQQKLLQCKITLVDYKESLDFKTLNEPIIEIEEMVNQSFIERNSKQIDLLEVSLNADEEDDDLNVKNEENYIIEDSNEISQSDEDHQRQLTILERRKRQKEDSSLISNFMELKCDSCKGQDDHIYATFLELKKHCKKTHKTIPSVKCCNSVFHESHKLADHIRWHRDPNIFSCKICKRQYTKQAGLRSHWILMHAPVKDPLYCEICKKSFKKPRLLKRHLRTHEQGKFECNICNKRFKEQRSLKGHIDCVHQNLHSHICDICGKKFKHKNHFERHILSHQGYVEQPIECQICGEWLKNKLAFQRHTYRHDHINVHCELCDRSFGTKLSLKTHIAYAHKIRKTYQCSYCDKTSKYAHAIKEHEATHTGVKLYSCSHCQKDFRSSANMYVHIKRQHPVEWLKSKEEASNKKILMQEEFKRMETESIAISLTEV